MVRLAYQTCCHAKRRRGQADDTHMRIDDLAVAQECSVHALAVNLYHMSLVHYNEIERLKIKCLLVDRLNSGDNNSLVDIAAGQSRRVNTDVELWRNGRQRIIGLLK